MSSRRTKLAIVGAIIVGASAAFASTFRAAPLDVPPAFSGELPTAAPPSEMRVSCLPTGVTHRSAAFAYRGGSLTDKRDFAMTAVLVRHPRGDVLVDTGLGRAIDAQFAELPAWFRATTSYVRSSSAAEQLDAEGYDRRRLAAILLTHAHWDHVSGIPDFPDTPIWVTGEERRFIDEGGWITGTARGFSTARWVEYGFEGGPYLGFPRSHDVHGDGAIVVVPAPGHTPGSVIVFVNESTGKRGALVGDLVWQQEGVAEREEQPWLQRTIGDDDPAGVRANILRMSALAARLPAMTIVPAHDARAFVAMCALR